MTNPKQAPEAQRPICDKPGCGMEMVNLPVSDPRAPYGVRRDPICPRSDSGHRLCAQLAAAVARAEAAEAQLSERDARIAELLQEAKKDTDAMLSAAQTCRDGKELVKAIRAQLAERDATILRLGEDWASQAHQLAERNARIAELTQADPSWYDATPASAFKMLAEARAQLDAANARAEAAEAQLDELSHDLARANGRADDFEGNGINLEAHLNAANARAEAAEAQLSEATDSLVTLREALEAQLDQPETPESYNRMMERIQDALSTTSHANSSAVERIREKALTEAWKRVDPMLPVMLHPGRWRRIRAAILNRDLEGA